MVVLTEVVVHLPLVEVDVHLAHGAHRDQRVGPDPLGLDDESPDELEAGLGADLGHVAATAVGAARVVDHVRAKAQQQLVERVRVLAVLPAIVVVWPRDEAAHVGRQLQAGRAAG